MKLSLMSTLLLMALAGFTSDFNLPLDELGEVSHTRVGKTFVSIDGKVTGIEVDLYCDGSKYVLLKDILYKASHLLNKKQMSYLNRLSTNGIIWTDVTPLVIFTN